MLSSEDCPFIVFIQSWKSINKDVSALITMYLWQCTFKSQYFQLFISAANWCWTVATGRYLRLTSPLGKHCTSQIGLTAVPSQGLFGLGDHGDRDHVVLREQSTTDFKTLVRCSRLMSDLIQTNQLAAMLRCSHSFPLLIFLWFK